MANVYSRRSFLLVSTRFAALAIGGCVGGLVRAQTNAPGKLAPADRVLINRLTWGLDAASADTFHTKGRKAFIESMFKTGPVVLPAPVQARIDAMMLSAHTPEELVHALRRGQRAVREASNEAARKAAHRASRARIRQLQEELMERSLLRSLYSPYQFQERLTWFWCNHFSVSVRKATSMRALVSDFEERAIRPHVFGRFEDLLMAAVRHPAMLIYLDNVRNRAGHVNENYGRELMELHTLGVGGGYTQSDVTNLSRALTGLGVNMEEGEPKIAKKYRDAYVREGLFEFHPARHDDQSKTLLGRKIAAGGMEEVENVVRILARHPSTAKHLARKLATYFVSDAPSQELVDNMVAMYLQSDGNLSAVLHAMLAHETFKSSLLEEDFKDPMRYLLSGIRMLYPSDERPVTHAAPLLQWLSMLDEQPFVRLTPDGYPIRRVDWQGSGQMATRFDVAHRMAASLPQLFQRGEPDKGKAELVPSAGKALYENLLVEDTRPTTRQALAQARNLRDWNELWLSSPDFMHA